MNFSNVENGLIKKIDDKYKDSIEITLQEWLQAELCECGGPIFKYHDTTSNIYVLKCGLITEKLDIKTKTLIKSKKQPCSFNIIHKGDKPDYSNLQIPVRKKQEKIDHNAILAENLESLFKFYFLAKKDITIQEINSLVKFKLNRNIRKIYYLVTAGPILKESHREPMEEYHSRIFSLPIIDRSIKKSIIPIIQRQTKKKLKKERKSQFIETDLTETDYSSGTDSDNSSDSSSDTTESHENECQINDDLIDDIDNLDLYDEPEEPEEYDYY